MQGFPSPTALDFLEQEGIRYVVVHLDLFPPGQVDSLEDALENEKRLELVYRADPLRVYRVLS
jgi:hypothetical protein